MSSFLEDPQSNSPFSLPLLSRFELLLAIRDKLISELSLAQGKDVAPIARELRAVIAEIDGLPSSTEGSTVDDLRASIDGKPDG